MRNHLQYRRKDAEKRCAICDGKFGLIRHYSWRTALCSERCARRVKPGDARPRHQASIVRFRSTMITVRAGFGRLHRRCRIENIESVDHLSV